MADYALIDGYVDTLRARMRWRGDVEDLVAEVRDHLYSAVEGLEAGGPMQGGLSGRRCSVSAIPS